MHIVAQPHAINPPTQMLITPAKSSNLSNLKFNMLRSIPIHSAPPVAGIPRQQTIGAVTTTHYRRPVFLIASPAASSSDASSITPQQQQAGQNLINLVKNNASAPTEAQLQSAVDTLLASGTGTQNPGPATMISGSGNWNVVHAPHINRMSSILGTKFSIGYTLSTPSGDIPAKVSASAPPQFYSNVRYESPLFGSGWLSASGRLFSN